MSELTTKTIAELREGFRAGDHSAREIAEAFNAAVVAGRSLNAYTVETPELALAAADAADRGAGGGRAEAAVRHSARHQGSVRDRGRRHHRGLEHPEGLQADLRKHRLRQSEGGGRGDARQAQHGRVRHGLVERDQRLWPGHIALGGATTAAMPRLTPADRRAVRRRRSLRDWRRASPAPTPAARSASPRPSPALAASSRPTAAARAGASSPSPPRSTRPGRWRATVRDCAIMLEAMAGFDPKDATSLEPAGAAVGSGPVQRPSRQEGRHSQGISHRRRSGRDQRDLGPGHRVAEGRGRGSGRDQPAAHQICAADLLHHRPGRGLVEPRPL